VCGRGDRGEGGTGRGRQGSGRGTGSQEWGQKAVTQPDLERSTDKQVAARLQLVCKKAQAQQTESVRSITHNQWLMLSTDVSE